MRPKYFLSTKKAKICARDPVWWCSLYGNRFATYNIYREPPFRALWTIPKTLGSDFLFHLPVTRQVDSENSGTTCRARVSRRSYPAPDPGPSTWTCFPGTPPPSSFHEIAPRTRSRTWTSFPGPPSHIISFKVQGTGGESEGGSKISFVFY